MDDNLLLILFFIAIVNGFYDLACLLFCQSFFILLGNLVFEFDMSILKSSTAIASLNPQICLLIQ